MYSINRSLLKKMDGIMIQNSQDIRPSLAGKKIQFLGLESLD